MLMRLVIVPLLVLAIYHEALAEVLNVDDPRLLGIREHIMKAYNDGRPPPIMQCTEERHHAAVKLYTRVTTSRHQNEMLAHMQSSLVKGEDNVFIGLPETIAALGSSKIQYMLYWDKLMINSATYRNPLSGKTVTQHTIYSPSIQLAFNYTEPETGCYMELISCYPLVKWISLFYRSKSKYHRRHTFKCMYNNLYRSEWVRRRRRSLVKGNGDFLVDPLGYVPQITRLEDDMVKGSPRNMYIKMSDGIGGRYSEVLRLADNKWLEDLYRKSAVRRTILLRGFRNATANSKETEYSMEDPEEARIS